MKLQNSPTILIVDDEELMREVVEVMVNDNGGKTLTAVDGVDAVEVFADKSDEIDLILMDFSMPRMDGYQAYLEIRKLKPELPIIFISGLQMSPEVEEECGKGNALFVSKPFKEDQLLGEIKKALTP